MPRSSLASLRLPRFAEQGRGEAGRGGQNSDIGADQNIYLAPLVRCGVYLKEASCFNTGCGV